MALRRRIVIAHEQKLFIDSLKVVLERHAEAYEIAGTAGEVREFIECVRRTKPHIIILDADLPEAAGPRISPDTQKNRPRRKDNPPFYRIEPRNCQKRHTLRRRGFPVKKRSSL